MPFKLFYSVNYRPILIVLALVVSGCQSIPNTESSADVIEKIKQHDQTLANNASDGAATQVKLSENQILTETEAVHYALHHNATFKAMLVDLKLAKADLVNASLLPNPDLLFAFGMPNKPYRYAIDLPIEALWLRPIRLRTMKNEADAAAFRLTQLGLNLIRDVRISYAQAVLAQARLQLANSLKQLREQMYTLSLKRLEAGDINGRDVLQTKNDAATAERDWALAQYQVAINMQALLNILGLGEHHEKIQLSPNLVPACQSDEIDQLFTQSLEQRPDIVSAQFAMQAAAERIQLSKLNWLKVTASADATSGMVSGHTLGPAIRVTIPIANQNQGVISRAEAELEKATLNLEALKHQALLEIKTTHLQYQQSCRDWQVLQEALLPTAQEMVQLTNQAYQKGDISYLQTLEAHRALLDAQMREAQLKVELISKYAELKRSASHHVNANNDVSNSQKHMDK